MKMQSMSSIRQARQAGFTLIELIVVIVILGILAATALPKFVSLGADARVASLTAVKGSMESLSAMAHGRYLIAGNAAVPVEGGTVTLVNGYPAATAAGVIAGLSLSSTDFGTSIANGTASAAAGPVTVADTSVAVFSKTAADASKCYVMYTAATAATSPPQITFPATIDCT